MSYQLSIEKFDLTINELDLIDEMSRFLRNRDKTITDDIRISFLPSDSNPYFPNAEIVKTGSGKSVAEVRFKHLL